MMIAAAALMMLTTACSDKKARVRGANDFAIEGTVTGAANQTLYLQLVTPDEVKTIDSLTLGDNGQFAFYYQRAKSPEIYRLSLNEQYIYLAIDSTETVNVNATYPKMSEYSVKGSDDCLKLKELNKKQAELQKRAHEIEMSEKLFPGQVRDSLLKVIRAYKQDIAENYLLPEPNKAYSYYALFQTLQHANGGKMLIYSPYDTEDFWAFGAVATSWSVFYPESERAKQLEAMTLDARKALYKRQATIDESIIHETGIFDIALPDALEKTHKLSELNGQVVVLNFNDFHAPESGAIVLALRELYAKYHERGLEIYQVGVTQDASWWRQSVDRLPWINVQDRNGYAAKLYNVTKLGEFFIIDRNSTLQLRVSDPAQLEAEIVKLL